MHIDEAFINSHPGYTLDAQVEFAEIMGAETYVHINVRGITAVAHTSRCYAQAGAYIKIAPDTKAIHLFDPGTQASILKRP